MGKWGSSNQYIARTFITNYSIQFPLPFRLTHLRVFTIILNYTGIPFPKDFTNALLECCQRRFFFHPDFRGTVFLWDCTHITRSPKLLGCLDFTDKSVALSTDAGGLPGRAQTSSSQPGPGHAAALEQSCCWHGHQHPCRGGTWSRSRVWCGAVSKWQKAALAFKWAYLLEQLSCGKSPLLSFRGGDVLVGVQPSSPWQPHSVFSQFKTISLWAGKRKANSEKKHITLTKQAFPTNLKGPWDGHGCSAAP